MITNYDFYIDQIDVVTQLACDLKREIKKRFGEMDPEVAHNIANAEISQVENSNTLPVASKMPHVMERANGREVNIANSYVVGNANVNRRQPIRQTSKISLNGYVTRNQSIRSNPRVVIGNDAHNTSLNTVSNLRSRRAENRRRATRRRAVNRQGSRI